MNFSKKNNNFASMIKEAIIGELNRRNISKRKCASDCGFLDDYRHFNEYLKGQRGYPIEKIEKVLTYLNLKIVD